MAINSWYDALSGGAWRSWLEAVGAEHQVKYRDIDPFDSSRRDFKEVPALLEGVANGGELPARGASGNQNLTDMRKARFCDGSSRTEVQLTLLGRRVLDAWQRAGVMAPAEEQELARYLATVLTARSVGHQEPGSSDFYRGMEVFWAEMRSAYTLDQLLDGTALHLIPFLARERDGFIPWRTIQANAVPLPQGWYEVDDFLRDIGGTTKATRDGADKLLHAMKVNIGGRVKDRQTWCAALEVSSLLESSPKEAGQLLESWR